MTKPFKRIKLNLKFKIFCSSPSQANGNGYDDVRPKHIGTSEQQSGRVRALSQGESFNCSRQ